MDLGSKGVRQTTSVLNCKCLNHAIRSWHLAFNLKRALMSYRFLVVVQLALH